MQIFTKAKVYNFMKIRWISLGISAILFFGSVVLFITNGLNYGIDFSGGTLVQLKYDTKAPLDKIRKAFESNEVLKNASVTEFGTDNEVTVRFSGSSSNLSTDIGAEIKELLKDTGDVEIRRVDIVGPKVGDELRQKGLMAICISFIAILFYIAFRFEWRFALAAIAAEIHDIVITIGAISLFAIDVNLDTLAAVLTVLGYSLNDKIIIFDRIRENIVVSKRSVLLEIINESVSSTLSRTILTSGTTMMVVVILFFFGGDMIHGFSLIVIVGVFIGTLSSIFMASPMLIWFKFSVENFRSKIAQKQKEQKERQRERAMFEKGVV